MLDDNPPAKAKKSTHTDTDSGIHVLCHNDSVLQQYNHIVHLAKNGNYWAQLIASGITGLTSGRLHQNNVFIHKNKGALHERGEFSVVLPGATTTLKEQGSGKLVLTSLNTDASYQAMQKNANKPGLWEVNKDDNGHWKKLKYISSNKTAIVKKGQWVVISDRQKDSVDAAISGGENLSDLDSSVSRYINCSGFKLHYTPGDKSIGGYTSYQQALLAEKCPKLHESALLLAQTMFEAREIENVQWMSDWGGSGVLTQALKILADNNVQLPKHAIHLNHPTTHPSKAVQLALKVGLNGDNITKKTGYMPSEVVGRMVMLGPLLTRNTPKV